MVATDSSETFATICHTTRCNIPEDYLSRSGNLFWYAYVVCASLHFFRWTVRRIVFRSLHILDGCSINMCRQWPNKLNGVNAQYKWRAVVATMMKHRSSRGQDLHCSVYTYSTTPETNQLKSALGGPMYLSLMRATSNSIKQDLSWRVLSSGI
jgi:hypothetical protein